MLPGYDEAKGFLFRQGERCTVVRRVQHAPILVRKNTRQHGLHFWVGIDDEDRSLWQEGFPLDMAADYERAKAFNVNRSLV